MKPEGFLASLVAVYCGWQAFADGPLGFYVLMGLWVVFVTAWIGFEKRGEWWPACLFGAWLGLMQSGCGLMYIGDGRSFLCDKGTGLPITALVLAVAAGLAAYYARKKKHGGATSRR